jgi:putative addiction module killer protein
MLKFRETEVFSKWLADLRDARARAHIMRRLVRANAGNFGDVAPVGEGISEMRINEGAGYRVYYSREGDMVYILLCGGDKKSQPRDIIQAKQLWVKIKRSASK